jgi:tetratricopeptide (TPR) repeat protein
LTAALFLATAACAEVPPPPVGSAGTVTIQLAAAAGGGAGGGGLRVGTSSSGDYLAGLIAAQRHDLSSAAEYMNRALAQDPDNPDLLRQTFLLVAADGRYGQAVGLARKVIERNPENVVAALVLIVDLVRHDDVAAAADLIDRMPSRGLGSLLVPIVGAWLDVAGSDIEGGLVQIGTLKDTAELAMHYQLHVALLNDVAGRPAQAEAAYRAALDAASQPSPRLSALAGNFFERQGKQQDAREIYGRYKANEPSSSILDPAIARLSSNTTPAPLVPGYKAGIAEVLFNLASILSQQRAQEQALVQIHLGLQLKPRFDLARLIMGEIMENQGRDEAAIAAYRRIDLNSPLGWIARLRVAEALERLGRNDEAISELEGLAAEQPGHYEPLFRVGNMLRAQERFAEAVTAYDRAFERLAAPNSPHWTMHYYRGIALERSGQWARAEKDLKTALELEPEQPYVMNYLAYSWVENQTHLAEAEKLLVRAVELQPKDGYIADSLGWVYFRLGNHEQAVTYLERAVELRPQDPVINDHLGDAYWKVGRHQEARFQWRRALSLEPESDQVPIIGAKIEDGLGAGAKKI